MNGGSLTVRGKVAPELGMIAVLTTSFLLLFPLRNPLVDVGLAVDFTNWRESAEGSPLSDDGADPFPGHK